jgi:hypothetical protein
MKITPGATDSQFIVHTSQSQAQEVVTKSLLNIGGIKSAVPGKIIGWGKYGLNKVTVEISFLEQDSETLMTINAKNGSVYSGPNKSLITRLVDAMANSENATFIPDKRGIGAGPLVASIVGMVVILSFIAWFVLFITA